MPDHDGISVKEYIAAVVAGVRAEIVPLQRSLEDHRIESRKRDEATNMRIDKLIEAVSRRHRRMEKLYWSAVGVCGTAIGTMIKFILDLVPHKAANP